MVLVGDEVRLNKPKSLIEFIDEFGDGEVLRRCLSVERRSRLKVMGYQIPGGVEIEG